MNDHDASGNPTWGVLSSALLAVVVAGPVFGVVQALVLRARGSKVYDDIVEVSSSDPVAETTAGGVKSA